MAVLLVMLATATGMFSDQASWLSPVTELHQSQAAVLPQVQAAVECEQTIASPVCVRDVPTAAEMQEQLDHIIQPRGTKRVADGSAKRAARRTWTQTLANMLVSTLKYVNAVVLGG